jgi:hypothetical protein
MVTHSSVLVGTLLNATPVSSSGTWISGLCLAHDSRRAVTARLMGLPLDIVPSDQELSELAGELKVVKKMSLADCFAAPLAKRAELYTGDPEFKTVEREIKVVWL